MQSDEQEIRQLVTDWLTATRNGDAQKILSLMEDDAVFLTPGQPVMHKADFSRAMAAQSGPHRPQFDAHSEIQELKIFGDWAFMWTRLSVVVMPDNAEPIRHAGTTLSILRKRNGKWRLARDANLLTTQQG